MDFSPFTEDYSEFKIYEFELKIIIISIGMGFSPFTGDYSEFKII